jgi:hypothetical protein
LSLQPAAGFFLLLMVHIHCSARAKINSITGAGRLCFDVHQIPADSIFFYGAAIEWSAPCDSGHSDHALSSATSLLLQATRSTALRMRPSTYIQMNTVWQSRLTAESIISLMHCDTRLYVVARAAKTTTTTIFLQELIAAKLWRRFWSQREVMRGTRPEEQKFLLSQIKIRSESYGSAQLISNYIRKKLLDSGYIWFIVGATQSEPVKNILEAHGCCWGIGVNKRAVAPVWQRNSNFPGTES